MFNTYNSFYEDIILHVDLLSLNKEDMKQIPSVSSKHSFDFDDAYQYCIAQKYNLTIVTMDKDFSKLKSSMVYFI
jgi:predicted nucleic acid-binding protein